MANNSKNNDANLAARMLRASDGFKIKVGGSVLQKDGTMTSGAPRWVKVPSAPSPSAVKTSLRPKKRQSTEDFKLELQAAEWKRVQAEQKKLLATSKAKSTKQGKPSVPQAKKKKAKT